VRKISAMNTFSYVLQEVWRNQPHLVLIAIFVLVIGLMAKMKLFAKANKNLWSAFVPIWDLMSIMEMVGRPRRHWFYMCIPIFNVYFGFVLILEIAKSFGKTSRTQQILAVVFNLFYILNLALSFEEEYVGPVHKEALRGRDAPLLNPI
jgi:signal peptidase I